MKKKILICVEWLTMGGISMSLINLLNNIDINKYDITILFTKKNVFYNDSLPKDIKIEYYNMSQSKNILFRKIINRLKLLKWIFSNKNKYDFSINYTTHNNLCATLALNSSKNNAIWVHGDYYTMYNGNEKNIKTFFNTVDLEKFKNIVFVSNKAKENIEQIYPEIKNRMLVIKNLIDYDSMVKKSNDEVEIVKEDKIVFLNVGRHTEREKNLIFLFDVIKKIKKTYNNVELWMVGAGPDHEMYKNYVFENGLEDTIKFLGRKENPYPYYKQADALLLTSKAEGDGIVLTEARVLGLPVITTDVADAVKDIANGYGYVTEHSFDDYYNAIEKFILEGYKTKKFVAKKQNNQMIKRFYQLIDSIDGDENA